MLDGDIKKIPVDVKASFTKATRYKTVTKWDDHSQAYISTQEPDTYTLTLLATNLFTLIKPEGGIQNTASTDDGKISLVLPLDGKWGLQSKTNDKLIIEYKVSEHTPFGDAVPFPTIFSVSRIPFKFKGTDVIQAELNYFNNVLLKELTKEYGKLAPADYSVSEKGHKKPISGITVIQATFSISKTDKKTGEVEYGYYQKAYWIAFKENTIYLIEGTAYNFSTHEAIFRSFAFSLNIN